MAAGTMATAAGAAVLLYYVLSKKLAAKREREDDEEFSKTNGNSRVSSSSTRTTVRRTVQVRRPAHAPATWLEALTTLSDTLRFTYAETLGKWPIADLAFGINYLMRRQGDLDVASVYAGQNSIQLRGSQIVEELRNLLKQLTLCMYFSKKPFPVFLECSGYSQEDVLLQKPKAGLLKPAFTIIRDENSKCFLLLIRGTHSIKDTLTAATGGVVPFHHSVLHDGGVSNLVLGYAHCGMVAAARWISKLSIPCLLNALGKYPDHKVKIIGHSLGGGTAALLTYILREQKEFSSTTCVTFAPAACMTWDLAESGKQFISTVINGCDLVPTFSAASVDDLRSEVTASSWLNDLRDQVERTRVLNVVYRSATSLGSHLTSIANARARVVGAGALLRPGTQVVMKRAQNVAQAVVRTRSSLSSWSCMGARRRTVGSKVEDSAEISLITERNAEVTITEEVITGSKMESSFSNSESGNEDTDDEEQVVATDMDVDSAAHITEGELWLELEKELQRKESLLDIQAHEEASIMVKEITEENVLVENAACETPISENQLFYPAGKIMHMVCLPTLETNLDSETTEERVGIYETPRDLYCKIRLSKSMINDHYMPMYKKMMEQLIRELENDDCVIVEAY